MLKGAVVDFLQAIKVSEQLNPSQPSKTALFGKSFADAPVTLAQAGTGWRFINQCCTNQLAEGRRHMVNAGSAGEINGYLKANPLLEDKVMHILGYFDPATQMDKYPIPCFRRRRR